MSEAKLLTPGESIRVKSKIADEWRKDTWHQESHPSTQTKDASYRLYSTDIALITGLLIEAISRLDALTPVATQEATRILVPAPTSAKDSTDVSPVVWKGTVTP